MIILGLYIYNDTQNKWLQDDEKSWGSFACAGCFAEHATRVAEDVRLRVSGDDVTFVMACLH